MAGAQRVANWALRSTIDRIIETESIMPELASRKCVPCEGGIPALSRAQFTPLLQQLHGWEVVEDHHLSKTYRFSNYRSAVAFVNRIADVAESEGHHPDLLLSWGKVAVEIQTHAVDGLTENDFVLAAKIDELPR
jgi:4a-hydroxytetrahydrobiopterin dehydratase